MGLTRAGLVVLPRHVPLTLLTLLTLLALLALLPLLTLLALLAGELAASTAAGAAELVLLGVGSVPGVTDCGPTKERQHCKQRTSSGQHQVARPPVALPATRFLHSSCFSGAGTRALIGRACLRGGRLSSLPLRLVAGDRGVGVLCHSCVLRFLSW